MGDLALVVLRAPLLAILVEVVGLLADAVAHDAVPARRFGTALQPASTSRVHSPGRPTQGHRGWRKCRNANGEGKTHQDWSTALSRSHL